MIICPSCGSTVEADLRLGCRWCGARAVGPPLAKAEHQLPSFGRGVATFAGGVVMSGGFLSVLIAALLESKSTWYKFWTIVSAGEVAAWRVKWAAFPIAIIALWSGARIIRSIKGNPLRFNGLRLARIGFANTIAVSALIAMLIGITIPERLRQRQYAIEAAIYARGYRLDRALLEYREIHGTYPTDPDKYIEALRTLPDADGSLAEALRFVDPNGYLASTRVAVIPKGKPLVNRGVALRNANPATTAEQLGVSFTSYDLSLPSEHRWFASDDDFIMRDGVIYKASELTPASSASRKRTP